MTDRDFDILIKNALTDAAVLDAEEADEIVFSSKYQKRKAAVLNKSFRPHKRRPQWKKIAIHAAVLVVVFLMGCTSSLLLPPQLSLTGLISVYSRSFPNGTEYSTISFNPTGDEPDDNRFWQPTYIPEGFSHYYFQTRSHAGGKWFIAHSEEDVGEHYIRFSQFRLSSYGAGGALKDHKVSISNVGNSEAYLYTSQNPEYPHLLFWLSDNGSTLFRIDADYTIDTDEMFKMAESLEVYMEIPFGAVAQVDFVYGDGDRTTDEQLELNIYSGIYD